MSRLDCSSAELKSALEDVSNPSSSNEWAVFGYVPKSATQTKVDATGSGFDDLVEEFSEGKVQYAYYRVPLKGAPKFVYIAWCGEGVTGMAKGSFGNHSNDFAAHLKKGFAVHHQVNARSGADLDEKKIQAALVKASGANYDAGAKKQGMDSTAKAMGELKTFHISEQSRATEVGTGRDSGSSGVAIDKTASDQYWQQNKQVPTGPSAAAPSARAAAANQQVEEERKRYWEADRAAQAEAKASAAKQAAAAPARGAAPARAAFQQQAAAPATPSSAPPARPAPGKINTSAFNQPPAAQTSAPPSRAPPSSVGGGARPAPGGAPPSRPAPGGGAPPPVSRPPPVSSAPPAVPAAAPPSLPPSLPPSAPPAALPPRMPDPEPAQDDGWGEETAAAAEPAQDYSQDSYAQQQDYSQDTYAQQGQEGQEGYAQEGYAQEEAQQDWSQPQESHEGYAQEEYAAQDYSQEGYTQEGYAQEEYAAQGQEEAYAQEEYAAQDYSQEGYAQEEYAQEEYAQTEQTGEYTQVQALFDYAGEHAEDLSFKVGDWITVYEKDATGWWKGEVHGVVGYFPSNFVQQ